MKLEFKASQKIILGRSLFFLAFLSSVVCFSGFTQQEKLPVIINGKQMDYLYEEGKITAKGDVTLKYKDMELFCDEAEYNTNASTAHIKGKLKIVKTEGQDKDKDKGQDKDEKITTIYGEDIVFDFNTQNAQIVNIRMEDPPIYGEAKRARKVGEEKYIFENGSYVTTCNYKFPHYRLSSKSMTVYPQERVVAKNVFFKVGDVPIFYMPYYSHSLKDEHFPVQVVPGKDEELGYFVLNSVRYDLNKENRGKIHGDWYGDRKWGLGVSHKAESDEVGAAYLKYYVIQDELYDLELREDFFERYPERRDIVHKYLEDDRYKMQMFYDWQPTEKLSIKAEYNKFSDSNFMKDFFFREYENEPHTMTYALMDYGFLNSSVSMLTQKRANHFYSETQYLPKAEYNFFNQPLGESNLYLESKSTAGSYNSKAANSDEDSDAVGFHTHNVLSYPGKIKWLSIMPYVGDYASYYSKNIYGDENILRGDFESGGDLSTKLYKIFNAKFNYFGEKINTMRHVLTPKVSYKYKHDPTILNSEIFQFDGNDGLSRNEEISFALDNKLQAKLKDKIWDFLYFSPSTQYVIDPENAASRFTTVTTALEIYPKEGISFNSSKVYDVAQRRITTVNLDLTLKDTSLIEEKYSVSLGHRYSRHSSTQGTFDLMWKVLPKLQFKTYLRHEYNTEDFQEKMYGFRADLHCWWLDFGVDIDKQRQGVNNHDFWIIFTLKDFPGMAPEFTHTYRGAKHQY